MIIGWWFQTMEFFLFHVIWMDVILPIDELHVFSRWLKSPTSMTWVWLWGMPSTYDHNEKMIDPWIQGRGTAREFDRLFFAPKDLQKISSQKTMLIQMGRVLGSSVGKPMP